MEAKALRYAPTAPSLDAPHKLFSGSHFQSKKLPLTAAGVQGLREEYTRSIEPARALAAETLTLERTR